MLRLAIVLLAGLGIWPTSSAAEKIYKVLHQDAFDTTQMPDSNDDSVTLADSQQWQVYSYSNNVITDTDHQPSLSPYTTDSRLFFPSTSMSYLHCVEDSTPLAFSDTDEGD